MVSVDGFSRKPLLRGWVHDSVLPQTSCMMWDNLLDFKHTWSKRKIKFLENITDLKFDLPRSKSSIIWKAGNLAALKKVLLRSLKQLEHWPYSTTMKIMYFLEFPASWPAELSRHGECSHNFSGGILVKYGSSGCIYQLLLTWCPTAESLSCSGNTLLCHPVFSF